MLGLQEGIMMVMDNETLAHVRLLQQQLDRTMAQYPEANRENVWHTLLLLEEDPWQRLNRSLKRGRYHLI